MATGLEASGKTVEEAVQKALQQLGLTEDKVEIAVLKKGKTGILGFGSDEARVLVTPKEVLSGEDEQFKEVACVVLNNILKTMGLKAMAVPGDPLTYLTASLSLDVQGEDVGILIGRRGQTLSSLQFILNLIMSHKFKTQNFILVDVAGYRKRRYDNLRSLALQLAEQVKRTGHPVYLEPMPPLERRFIHIALAEDPQVSTSSDGQGDRRKVVISLKKKQ